MLNSAGFPVVGSSERPSSVGRRSTKALVEYQAHKLTEQKQPFEDQPIA